jgi:fermentation-respiration switch protein FrsA (DUF1100 family)
MPADEPLSPGTPATARRRWPLWFRVLRTLAIIYVAVCVIMMFLERSLLFFPTRYPGGDWQPFGLKFEDAEFTAADGVKLHGWYMPHESPRGYLLLSHGNGGNLTHRADMLRELNRLGVATLIFDYRGYGKSEGSPDEKGILADGRAARAWLAKRAGIAERDVVQMGESLGGGVAVDLAAADGARGLVLLNTFSSLPDAAAVHYPWLPVHLLMRTRLDSASKIANFHGPLLECHGDADTIVPYASGRKLFEAANEPKEFVSIRGGDHNDIVSPQFYQALDKFLDRL